MQNSEKEIKFPDKRESQLAPVTEPPVEDPSKSSTTSKQLLGYLDGDDRMNLLMPSLTMRSPFPRFITSVRARDMVVVMLHESQIMLFDQDGKNAVNPRIVPINQNEPKPANSPTTQGGESVP